MPHEYSPSASVMNQLAYLKDAFKSLADCIYWKDTNGVYLGCNQVFLDTAGLKAVDEVVGKTDDDFPWKHVAKLLAEHDHLVLDSKKAQTFEETLKTFNGESKRYSVVRAPLFNDAGEIFAIIVTATETKKHVLFQVTEPQFLQNIIEFLPEYIYWKDKNLVYQGCNRKVSDFLGLPSPTNIIGKTDYDFDWSQERIQKLREMDELIVSEGINNAFEDVIPTAEDEVRVMLSSKSPLYDSNGMVIGVLGVSTDITDIKKSERKLLEAKKKAEVANEAKTEFIANMSHDIRTPLTGILGMASVLKDRSDNDANRNDIDLMISATEELLNLLNEILELTEIESGHIKREEAEFSLSECLQQNIRLLILAATHKKLNLNMVIEPNVPSVVIGNKTLLDRIVSNLLSNAIKFTEAGDITASVRCQETKIKKNHGKVMIELIVTDTGIGIPSEQYEHIFEHFSRLTSSYQGIYKGSGLGLYTVKRYVDVLGGTIKIESEVDKGSSFTVTVPLQVASTKKMPFQKITNPTSKTSIEDTIETLSTETMGTIRVLLVEDQPLAAKVTSSILKNCGCNVDHAPTGATAIKKAQAEEYDLIYMDVGLPDIDGFKVTQTIRQLPDKQKANVPIVALTAHANQKKQQACLDANIQDMLTKPLTKKMATEIINHYVHKQKT